MIVALGLPRPRAHADTVPARDPERPDVPGLVDRFGRTATDLRVSLTNLCNLRCTYCMPADGLPEGPTISRSEVVRLVDIATSRLGVLSLRLTGGEPLLRHDLLDIVRDIAALPRRPELSLTTNAVGLASRAQALSDAGLDRVNISLDSLRADTFAAVSRRPLLRQAMAGIEAAAAVFTHIKINAVLLPGVNDHEAGELLSWALERGFELRFIEQMPLGADRDWSPAQVVTGARTRALLGERFTLEPVDTPRDGAPAELWSVRASATGKLLGTVGIIASVTEPFCTDCTRTRITADGAVRSCLFARQETPLVGLLRGGASDEAIANAWRDAMWQKQAGHSMHRDGFAPPQRSMSEIGG